MAWSLTKNSTGRTAGSFQPKVYDIGKEAFRRINVNLQEAGSEHWKDVIESLNFIQIELSTEKAYLPSILEYDLDIKEGDSPIELPEGTIELVNVTLTPTDGRTNIKMRRIDIDQWATYPDKELKGAPYQYFYDRGANGHMLRLYPVPDNAYTLTANIQMEPKTISALNESIDTTNIWYSAIVAKLATQLAQKYKPEMLEACMTLEVKVCNEARAKDSTRTKVRMKFSSPFCGR